MYRTIEKTFKILKAEDPETAITKYSIRKFAVQGLIRSLNTGKKVLIDVGSLRKFLETPLNN